MNNQIYLDNAATTKVAPEVFEVVKKYSEELYGNAGSLHTLGQKSKNAIIEAKDVLKTKLGAQSGNVIFTGCGTEANNLAVKGIVLSLPLEQKRHLIISEIEHDCILNASKWLSQLGINVDVTYLSVDKQGLIDPQDVKNSLRPETVLVSVMHANNEIGTIEPIAEIGKICRENKVLFHTDASQSFTKVPLNIEEDYVDLVTINAHKIHGPKGIAALYVKENINLTPLLHGGGQEKGFRSGTENIPGIMGFATAVSLHTESDIINMTNLRDNFIKQTLSEIPNTSLNGHPTLRLCNNINISFEGINAPSLVLMLDSYGISASVSSACNSLSLEPSHVARAIRGTSAKMDTIRFSLSKYTTEAELSFTFDKLKQTVESLRK